MKIKQLMPFVMMLSLMALTFSQLSGIITESKAAVEKNSQASVTLICDNAKPLVKSDVITFNVGESSTNVDPTITVTEDTPQCPYEGKVDLQTVGLYNIFLTRPGITLEYVKQPGQQKIANSIGVNAITNAVATGAEINKSVSIALTIQKNTFINGDTIIFAITSATSSEKREVLIGNDDNYGSTTITTPGITFDTEGVYKVWVKRGSNTQEQANVTFNVIKPTTPPESNANIITSAKEAYSKQGEEDLLITVSNKAKSGDIIYFSTTDPIDANAKTLTVSSIVDSQITSTLDLEPGVYYLFYKLIAESSKNKQNVKQIVFAKQFEETTISSVTGANVKANKLANIKIIFTEKTLYTGDSLILSTSTGPNISNNAGDNVNVILSNVDFSKTEHTQLVLFNKGGTYSIWIHRGTTTIKQTGAKVNIIVAMDDEDTGEDESGNWISISFVLLIGICLL